MKITVYIGTDDRGAFRIYSTRDHSMVDVQAFKYRYQAELEAVRQGYVVVD